MESNFAKRLNLLLKQFNLSQKDLSDKVNIDRSLINKYIHKNINPSKENIKKIADYFDVNPAWLCGFDVPVNEKSIDIIFDFKNFNKLSINEQEEIRFLITSFANKMIEQKIKNRNDKTNLW